MLPRAAFDDGWRTIARSLTNRPAGDIKRVIGGATPAEAVSAFAHLWVDDAHWAAADR